MFYFLPTPIGNLKDITLRTLDFLKSLEIFLVEDKNATKKLFSALGISWQGKQFFTLNSFTTNNQLQKYLSRAETSDVGIISEAGMPGFSDPGKEIIKYATQKGIKFSILPGANSLIPAVVGASWNTSKFLFMGYAPTKKGREKFLDQVLDYAKEFPVFFLESVHRVKKLIEMLKNRNFDGEIYFAKEISKIYENFITLKFSELDNFVSENPEFLEKGEFVLGIYLGKK